MVGGVPRPRTLATPYSDHRLHPWSIPTTRIDNYRPPTTPVVLGKVKVERASLSGSNCTPQQKKGSFKIELPNLKMVGCLSIEEQMHLLFRKNS